MADTFKEISPSYFRRYASLHAEIWNDVIGKDVVHVKWGKCTIEKIEGEGARLRVGGHHIAISGFNDDSFSGLLVSSELADTIMAYIKRRDELDEQEWAELDRKKLLEAQRQAELQAEVERIEQERKQLKAARLAKIKEEAENRRRLELQRQTALEQERRNQKQQRAQAVQAYCKQRGIARLFHFTRIENLSSILEHGLLGRHQLDCLHLPTSPKTNDSDRFDGFPDALCLSISYPNYKMFYKLSMSNRMQWVMLVLEPYILWEFDCAFFETNAASALVKNLNIAHRKEYSSLVRIFGDQPNVKRCNLPITNEHTTDPQAEVLVFEPIPAEYIARVYFFNDMARWNWMNKNQVVPELKNRLIADPIYFRPREDYMVWSSHKERTRTYDVPRSADMSNIPEPEIPNIPEFFDPYDSIDEDFIPF